LSSTRWTWSYRAASTTARARAPCVPAISLHLFRRLSLSQFQPFAEDQVADADFVLGTSFLHNAYALFSASGLVIDGDAGNAFVQLLPLTDPAQAHREFVAARVPVQSAASGGAAANASAVNFGGLAAGVLESGAVTSAPSVALIATCTFAALSHLLL
jgi:hypothetical protein